MLPMKDTLPMKLLDSILVNFFESFEFLIEVGFIDGSRKFGWFLFYFSTAAIN